MNGSSGGLEQAQFISTHGTLNIMSAGTGFGPLYPGDK